MTFTVLREHNRSALLYGADALKYRKSKEVAYEAGESQEK